MVSYGIYNKFDTKDNILSKLDYYMLIYIVFSKNTARFYIYLSSLIYILQFKKSFY